MTVYWTRLDRAEMANRVNLKADDMCFYYHIHTTQSERGSGFTEANSLIEDFKKTPELLSSRPDLVVWKKDAVTKCARLLWSFLNDRDGFFGPYEPLLVPMPTSRPRGSDCRDDRLDDACGIVAKHTPWIRYCELIDVTRTLEKSHHGGTRNPSELKESMAILDPQPPTRSIVLFDDVLTTGAHFRACKDLIDEAYGGRCAVVGVFVAIHEWAGSPVVRGPAF